MKTFLNLSFRILLYLLAMLLLSALLALPLAPLFRPLQTLAYGPLLTSLLQRACMLVGALLPAWLLLKYDGCRPFSVLGLSLQGRVGDFLGGAFTALLLYLAGFTAVLLTGVVKVTAVHADAVSLCLSLLLMSLVAIAEEVAVRGYLLGRLLHAGVPRYTALCISAALFALMHLMNPHIGLLPLLNIFLAGCLLGVAYTYTRNLWFAIGLHLFWNWLQGPVLGFEVSGADFGTTLFTLQPMKGDLLTGGFFGFEGSLICTVATLLAIVSVDLYLRQKRNVNGVPPVMQA
ncbi:MAG: CPBP family intramembrane metalloprotease [Prevotellaceae bacterium]|nr:CPBP family intramembrane metalloprotease [Prevotellaceae bacterium]